MKKWLMGFGFAIVVTAAFVQSCSTEAAITIATIGLAIVFIAFLWWIIDDLINKK